MRFNRRVGRASLVLAIAALCGWHVQAGRAVTTLDSGSSTAIFTHTQPIDGGPALQSVSVLDIGTGALTGGVLSSADDVTVGVAGSNPLPTYPLVGLSTGTSVTQTRGAGSFTSGEPSIGTIDVDVRYDIDNALTANTFAYFYTLANLVVAGPADEASINVDLTYTLTKADGGGTESVNIMTGDDASGTSKFNTTLFGFGQIPNATAPAPSNGTHVLEVQGTITMTALDPAADAKSNGLHNHRVEWTAMEDPGDATVWSPTGGGTAQWIGLPDVQPSKVPVNPTQRGIDETFRFGPGGLPPGGSLSLSLQAEEMANGQDITGQSATFELWIRPNPATVNMREQIVVEFGGAGNGISFSVAPSPDTPDAGLQLAISGPDAGAMSVTQGLSTLIPNTVPANGFIQVVGVVDMENDLLELYVNDPQSPATPTPDVVPLGGIVDWADGSLAGLAAGSIDSGGVGGSTLTFFGNLNNYESFDGDIAVIRIFDFAMDTKEVAGLLGLDQDASRIEDEIPSLLRSELLLAGLTNSQIDDFFASLDAMDDDILRTPGGGLLMLDIQGNGGGASGIPEPTSAALVVLAGAAMLRRRRAAS